EPRRAPPARLRVRQQGREGEGQAGPRRLREGGRRRQRLRGPGRQRAPPAPAGGVSGAFVLSSRRVEVAVAPARSRAGSAVAVGRAPTWAYSPRVETVLQSANGS